MQTCGRDLRTGKGLGLVLGFMLRVRASVGVRVKIKVSVSSSILPCCRSAGLVRSSHFTHSQQTVEDNANRDCKEFLNSCNDCFLTQHVLEHTRGNAVLDLVFSREPDLVSDVRIIEYLGNSDHNMVAFSVQHEEVISVNKRLIPEYNKDDYQSICDELKRIDNTNVCGDWGQFKKILLNLEDRYVPFKNIVK